MLVLIPITLFSAQQEYPQEEVTVIAVEVPVRVLRNGRAVRDLIQSDFELYENGIPQQITAFEIVSRKISTPKRIRPDDLTIPPQPRLFILIFNIFDYNDYVGEGIDYFFNYVFQPGDRFIILTEDRLLNIEIGRSLPGMIQDLKETLRQYKLISTNEIDRAYRELRFEANRINSDASNLRVDGDQFLRFLEGYLRIWKIYKSQFISPNTDLYQSIISRVKQIQGDKWAICFQQRELFPRIKKWGSIDRKIQNLLERDPNAPLSHLIKAKHLELERSLDYTATFPADVLQNLFLGANVTFHLILLKSRRDLLSDAFELEEVAQDYEECFKEISRSTGGYTTFSNNVTEAIQAATEVEDFHYLLVYSPKEDIADQTRKIKVNVKKKGVKVIHLKNIQKQMVRPITISDFKSEAKAISFAINDYDQENIDGKSTAIVDIKVTLFDKNSVKIFNEGKTLNPTQKETNVFLNFGALESGRYYIIIQVIDKITNEVDVYSGNITL